MKQKKFCSAIICSLIIITIVACKKEGMGGKATLAGAVKHHTMVIPNSIVYIKYGAKEFPGTDITNYNFKVTADISGKYAINNLASGDYYLYCIGYDQAASETVFGGIFAKIKWTDRKKETNIDIQVTE